MRAAWAAAGLVLLAGCGSSPAARPAAAAPPPSAPADAAGYADAPALQTGSEFTSPADLAGWRISAGDPLDGAGSPPGTASVAGGELQLVPARSEWLNGRHGVGAARTVTGDVMVTAHVLATGRSGPDPGSDWSLTGVMLRAPLAAPGDENWVHLSAGRVGGAVVERKLTVAGVSKLELIDVPAGWVDLRLVRAGAAVLLLHRPTGGSWVLDHTYLIDLPATCELLLTGQTGAEGGPADLVGHVDWVHVAPSPLPAGLAAGAAAGRADPAGVLAALGA